MCGIAGIMMRQAPPDAAALDAMADALAHRGPDGRGRYVRDGVGLVHTRLAIIDLETGDQPLRAADGTALVANGEIYNHLELRAELGEGSFRTRSDCEAALHLYRRDGLDFVDGLRGMYAVAIHDPARDRLVLARDPFGIKPLYYVEADGVFAFASEVQALLASGLVDPVVDESVRAEFIQLRFTSESILAGIRRVLPGETLVVEEGRVVARQHRSAVPKGVPHVSKDADAAVRRLDDILAESVELHQRADVPYGMFLSGGVDSAAILALMARLNSQPVLAFTAGFPGTGVHDEREHARAVASAVGATHVEVPVGEADFWALLPRIAAAVDDPVADYAIVPTYIMAREASRHVKVVLSGEGGDELFAGYGRYRGAMRPWPLTRPLYRRGALDRIDLPLLRRPAPRWRDGFARAERAAKAKGRTRLQRAQLADMQDWLAHDLLIKLDRCLMAHGVEGRVPLLDPVVADFAFRLPDNLKVRGKMGKWLLRRWLEQVLPEAKPFSPKRGFDVPVAEWIAGRPELGDLVARQPGIAEACRPEAVKEIFRRSDRKTGFVAWTLLFYALWHRHHVLRLPPQGDVFEALAATG